MCREAGKCCYSRQDMKLFSALEKPRSSGRTTRLRFDPNASIKQHKVSFELLFQNPDVSRYNPPSLFTCASHEKADKANNKMVAMYTVAGRQVGSHVVCLSFPLFPSGRSGFLGISVLTGTLTHVSLRWRHSALLLRSRACPWAAARSRSSRARR